jgi:hypothetical protein
MVCGEEGQEEVKEDGEIHSILCGSGIIWECKTFMEKNVWNGKKCMYFVCDFNGRWLKDSKSCCMIILLSEEGKLINNMQVGCFIELVVLYFF